MSESDIEKIKPKSPRAMFVERMKREGRGAEWHSGVKRIMAEQGKTAHQAECILMKEMGYEGPAKERELWQTFVESLHKSSERITAERVEAEQAPIRRMQTFEAAMLQLPPTASAQEELDWVRAHPAMNRFYHRTDKTKDVILTADDIVSAPSKSAAQALQHWVNHPSEFWKQLLGEQKKQTDNGGAGGAGASGDIGISEIEALLKQATS